MGQAQSLLFLTGGTGFVGRRLVARLLEAGRPVTMLVRAPQVNAPPGAVCRQADLLAPDSYRDLLGPTTIVAHLAALTGRASRADLERTNVRGTAALVKAGREARVRGILLVSSIAAGYSDKRQSWYARSKEEAEHIVASSGLPYTIVRPTQVMGEGSPVAASLSRVANLPVPIVFGSGKVRVQPIDVDDLAARLAEVLDRPFVGETLAMGGPEVLTMTELITRLRRPEAPRRRPIHVPLEPLRFVLGLIEPILGPLLPFTAGQLSAFANDGVAVAGTA